MPNHTGRLVLTPADPQASPDRALVIDVLTEAGFIGSPLSGRDDAYAAGPELLALLTFTGCAVAVPVSPGASSGGIFCHVRVPRSAASPRLVAGRNTRPPRCSGCRARLGDWRERAPGWLDRAQAAILCPVCGETRPPWRWDWKQQGGFGRLFVLVEEIFPDEAVPTPRLLDLLTRADGSGWRHFYVQD